MPNSIVVVGAQWGDESKGKVVDLLSEDAAMIVRYGGGNNAGHTLVVNGKKIILHLIPSAVMHPDKQLILGNLMVIDPECLHQEINDVKEMLRQVENERERERLFLNLVYLKISPQAHILMPYHRELDKARESNSKNPIGTTGRGIGPAYEAKAGRYGIRYGHLRHPELFAALVEKALEEVNPKLKRLGKKMFKIKDMVACLEKARADFLPHITNINTLVSAYFRAGRKILFEGAQGAALDLDHGTYPFVTSSNTLAAGACLGAGIGPNMIGEVIGVSKVYTTRVGKGPFPTKIGGELEEKLREAGKEYGATTGRPRDCGWLDLPQLRYAVRNGITRIFFAKLDVLRGINPIKVCHSYKINGEHYSQMDDVDTEVLDRVEPIYTCYPGFDEDISSAKTISDLPPAARDFIMAISKLGILLAGVSVGPDREQTIWLNKP